MTVRQNKSRRRRGRFIVSLVAAIGLIVVVWLSLFAAAVYAIGQPTSIAIEDVRAYRGVLEQSDLLIIVEYNLPYASLPDEIISDAYVGRFLRGTTELNSVEPFAFNDKGYGRGIFSMYWTPADVTSDSIEWSNTNSEDYRIRFEGKVGVFTGAVPSTVSSTLSWQSSSQTKNLLRDYIKAMATKLEQDSGWNDNPAFDDLIGTGEGGTILLTSTGEEYFARAVPNLPLMIPEIFAAGVTVPDTTRPLGGNQAMVPHKSLWSGNWVDTHFRQQAEWLGISPGVFKAFGVFLLMGILVFMIIRLAGDEPWAGVFGLMSMGVIFTLAVAVNMVDLQFGVVVAFLCAILIGWMLLGRRSYS